jgi:plastocyanin
VNRRTFLRAAGVASVSAVAGCGGDRATPTPPQKGDITATLGAGDFFFDPIGLYVEVGDTVEWVNGKGLHSVASMNDMPGRPVSERRIPEGAAPWYSGLLEEFGETFRHTFETPGTYDFYCNEHKGSGMAGRIVVGEPGGPADDQTPPIGVVPSAERIVEEGSVAYDDFDG